jgi:hypothetical protein
MHALSFLWLCLSVSVSVSVSVYLFLRYFRPRLDQQVRALGALPVSLGLAPYPAQFKPKRAVFRDVGWHKLRLFLLSPYEAVVALDSDLLVVANVDFLVQKVLNDQPSAFGRKGQKGSNKGGGGGGGGQRNKQQQPSLQGSGDGGGAAASSANNAGRGGAGAAATAATTATAAAATTTMTPGGRGAKVVRWFAARDETPLCVDCNAFPSGAPSAAVSGLRPDPNLYARLLHRSKVRV